MRDLISYFNLKFRCCLLTHTTYIGTNEVHILLQVQKLHAFVCIIACPEM